MSRCRIKEAFILWDGIIHTLHTTPEPELLTGKQKLTNFTPGRMTPGKPKLYAPPMVGGTYYAAVKVTILSTGEAETFAAVVLTHTNSRDYFNFGVKTMGESSGPCEDHCPASILSLLSPTDSEYANNWRERCRKNIEAKKDPHALKNLPVGAVIRFTLHTGESIELLKHAAAYQFKRPFWFCQSSGRYMPATRIPANYEVVTA